jgi:predicted dehydrogenase
MSSTSRRQFVKGAALAGAAALRPAFPQRSANETVNLGVVGIHGRGREHYNFFSKVPNVRVAFLCDIDERLFPQGVADVERLYGRKPETFTDIRKMLERKDLDAITVASPDHWHALHMIWGCQAGKDVYSEKPVSYCLREGRKMVEAARKYNRIVQAGLNLRSEPRIRAGAKFVRDEKFGKVYRAKAIVYRGRVGIGKVQESSIPQGVNWDMFLGPAPYRAFTLNRFHYGWHFFWDTSTTEVGNNGVHYLDQIRLAWGRPEHPVKIACTGGRFADDSDQEVPNYQVATFEYADGSIIDLEVTTLPSPPIAGIMLGVFFYTPRGYITSANNWSTSLGEFTPRETPDTPTGVSNRVNAISFPNIAYKPGPPIPDLAEPEVFHWQNFIDCVRSRRREDLRCEIEEGHLSTSLCHLANIAFRTGRKLTFDPKTETFPGDAEANRLLTRTYRPPYVVPDQV